MKLCFQLCLDGQPELGTVVFPSALKYKMSWLAELLEVISLIMIMFLLSFGVHKLRLV